MPDREKVISTFEKIISVCKEDGCDFVDLTFEDAEQILALLKEQEHKDRMYHALEDDWKRLKELLKEQEAVVRCKDCKHRPKEPNWKEYESGFDLEFPEGSKCPCRCSGDKWYSWYPEDDWFCADGERKPTQTNAKNNALDVC